MKTASWGVAIMISALLSPVSAAEPVAAEICLKPSTASNPWPVSDPRSELFLVCKAEIVTATESSESGIKNGYPKELVTGMLGISPGDDGAEPSSLVYEFGHQIEGMLYGGKSSAEIEKTLFCKCLALPVKAAADNGLSAYH